MLLLTMTGKTGNTSKTGRQTGRQAGQGSVVYNFYNSFWDGKKKRGQEKNTNTVVFWSVGRKAGRVCDSTCDFWIVVWGSSHSFREENIGWLAGLALVVCVQFCLETRKKTSTVLWGLID